MSTMGGWHRERARMTARMLKEEDDGRKSRRIRMRYRRAGVTNLAAILVRDISARLRLLINKQYCCEIGLMTK